MQFGAERQTGLGSVSPCCPSLPAWCHHHRSWGLVNFICSVAQEGIPAVGAGAPNISCEA